MDAATYPDFVHSGTYAAWANYTEPDIRLYSPWLDVIAGDSDLTFWADTNTDSPNATMTVYARDEDGMATEVWNMHDEAWGGAFVRTIKGNQSRTQDDIELLFAPGFSPSHKDFRTATTREKGHGRLERRTLTASSLLKDYVNWPYAEQVFRIEHRFLRIRDDKLMKEAKYGVTSLTAAQASPARLLELVRAHWGIENGLHYRRDETFRQDRCRLTGQGARAMAAFNNLVLGLLRRRGVDNVPDACRYYAANLEEAAALILQSPALV